MEDYYEYLDSNGVTTLYKLIKDDTVALIDSYSVTINGITTNLDNHVNNADIHTPIADIEGMIDTAVGSLNYATPDYVDTKVADLVNSSPETLDTLKELSDALGNDSNFATTVANQIGSKANKDDVYTKGETDTLLESKASSVHNHVVSDITDFPTIPTKTSQLINDSGFLTSSNGLITSVSWSDITNKPNFSTVATSGSYTDLSNTPTIPTKVSQLENDMGFGTGGDTSDCVHKTGDETIAGVKSFTSDIVRKYTAVDITTTPTSDMQSRINFTDKNDKIIAYIQYAQKTKGVNYIGLRVRDKNSTTCGVQLNTNKEFVPLGNNSYSLGSSSYKWLKIYSDDVVHTSGDETIGGTKIFSSKIVGNLQGNADTATSANDPNAVHTTGTETINGTKTFTQSVNIKNNNIDLTVTPTNTLTSNFIFKDKNDQNVAFVQYAKRNVDPDILGLYINDKDKNLHGIQITTNNYLIPRGHNTYNLGSPNNKWANVYATTFNGNLSGTIASSTTATTQATSDNSTKIATTAWVRTYVNSVVGSRSVGLMSAGPSSEGASILAYYSNATTLTAEGHSSQSIGQYPADYSDYINIAPTVGTIYTGSQLFSSFTPTASGTINKESTEPSTALYHTTAKATATFSGAFSASAKYLCTTANAVRFRAYVPQGTDSGSAAASVVDNSSAKSIFTRIE